MAGITLEQASAQLDMWLLALTAIAQRGQEYDIDTGNGGRRRLKRGDLKEVRDMVDFWDAKVKALTPPEGEASRRTTFLAVDHQ